MKSYESTAESSKESNSDKTENSDKQDSAKAKIGGLVTAEKITPPVSLRKSERIQSLWEKLTAAEEKPKPEIVAPEASIQKVEEKNTEQEAVATDDESVDESEIEPLTQEETHQAVQKYAEARKAALLEESQEMAENDSEPSAETAANIQLLDIVEKEIAENPDKSVDEVLETAEATVTGIIASESNPDLAEADTVTEAPSEGEIKLHEETDPADTPEADPLVVIPHGTTGSSSTPPPSGGGGSSGSGGHGSTGGGGGGTPPPRGGSSSGTPPFGGGGGSGGGTPGQGGGTYPWAPRPGGFNVAPPVATTIGTKTPEAAFADERRALAQGLLVGGIVGYFIGRRRGRIKTEKRLLPIQKKLEKQVSGLHAAVAEREQKIRNLTTEKVRLLKTDDERRRLVNRLTIQKMENVPAVEKKPELSQANHTRKGPESPKAAEQISRLVVEAPAVVLGAAASLRPERKKEEPHAIIDFNKKVEAYTTTELKQASEKIRVDGITLKELWDTNRLDEKALRRVVTEFVEGGSVRAALNKELLEKELRYERDPRMRQLSGSSGSAVTGTSAGVVASVVGAITIGRHTGSDTSTTNDLPSSQFLKNGSGSKPTPDQATLDKIKKQQMVQLAAGGAVAVTFIAALLAMFL